MSGGIRRLLILTFGAIVLPLIGHATQAPRDAARPAGFELRLAQEIPGEGLSEAIVEHTDKKIYLFKEALITGKDLIEARVVEDEALFRVDVVFTPEAAQRMARASQEHIGKPIAIMVDGKVLSAPIVRSMFSDRAAIAGSFTREEAESLANRIRSR